MPTGREVDPPREFPTQISQFWKDPWTQEWEHFRRHLVKLHYDELSRWVAQTGIPASRIYSSQGFMPPGKLIDPFAVRLDSPAKNMTPAACRSKARCRSRGAWARSSMATAPSTRSAWKAMPRCSTSSAAQPGMGGGGIQHGRPDHARADGGIRPGLSLAARHRELRRALRLPDGLERQSGEAAGTREYVGYTSLRRTPGTGHHAIHDVPLRPARGARLWTSGAGTHDDTDQWQAERGSRIAATPKGLRVVLDGQGRASVVSPAELAVRRGAFDALIVQADGGGEGLRLGVEMQVAGGAWQPLVDETPVQQWDRRSAGFPHPAAGGVRPGCRFLRPPAARLAGTARRRRGPGPRGALPGARSHRGACRPLKPGCRSGRTAAPGQYGP